MANQSPLISIPHKATEEVDWTTPIRSVIAQSYGENPDSYAAECAALQRCRQDAVRGAGSDTTARDLLYKYFGQLELLELRFAEIRVNFPWKDAFTNKLTTQTSIAFEKASVLFQIASTHSAIAASQSRSDPEGLKRAFTYLKTCAGMLTYINENFLHAPSTDLSREVIKYLVGIILAQATEVFFEKCTDEKKSNALVAKIAAQAASMYTTLTEDVKEFMGKGIFDRNWVTLIQIKAKYFSSLAQYHRGLADQAVSKYGEALVRFNVADSLAKEASRSANSFNSSFISTMSPTLPSDAGSTISDRLKGHLAIVSERRNEMSRENDLIYNAILPAPETLPALEKTAVAIPIPIQEVYGTPEVQKTIGQDIFIRLIPLSVHESASVYSEEKAKLVRAEVEKADLTQVELTSALDEMGVKEGLKRFKAMAEGEVGGEDEVPLDVRRWRDDITVIEERESVPSLMDQLNRLKSSVGQTLDGLSQALDTELRNCEAMRVKYDHKWTQEPSGGVAKAYRQDIKAHFASLEAAAPSDQQVVSMWQSVQGDIGLLLGSDLESVFRASTEGGKGVESLLDLDVSNEVNDAHERAKIGQFVSEIDQRLGKLNKISRERNEVLKDLKEKVQNDDVSHLLLLNRRNTAVEPTLFATELEKFVPLKQRLEGVAYVQSQTLQEISQLWKGLKDVAGRGPGARKWEEREKRKKETVRRFSRARDVYMEIRDGLANGLQFYGELTTLVQSLQSNVKSFVAERTKEKERLVSQLEVENRLASAPPPMPAKPPVPSSSASLTSSFSSLSLSDKPWQQSQSPPPPQHQYSSYGTPPPSQPPSQPASYSHAPPSQTSYPTAPPHHRNPSASFLPPPPPPQKYSSVPQPAHDSYAALGFFGSTPSAPPPPPPQQQYTPQPPAQPQYQPSPPPHPQYQPSPQQQRYQSPPPQQQYQSQAQQHWQQYPPQQYGGGGILPPPSQPQYQSTGQQQRLPPPPPPPAPLSYPNQNQHQGQSQSQSQSQPQYGGYQPQYGHGR